MSVKATLQMQLTVLETLTAGVADVSASGAQVRHDQFNIGPTSLSSASTPPASAVSSSQQTGTQTLDFTDLPGVNGAVVNGTGLKLQALLITNLAANTGPMTVAPGGANPLQPLGANAVTIPLGASALVYLGGNGPSIDATHKTVTFTPNNPADKYNVVALIG
jgi:hypothetical protein